MERTIGDGRVRNTGYDYEQTDGFGNTTRTTYDNFGRVTSTIDALGYATTYGYDALGQQQEIKRYSLERYSQVASEGRRPFCIRAFMATSTEFRI